MQQLLLVVMLLRLGLWWITWTSQLSKYRSLLAPCPALDYHMCVAANCVRARPVQMEPPFFIPFSSQKIFSLSVIDICILWDASLNRPTSVTWHFSQSTLSNFCFCKYDLFVLLLHDSELYGNESKSLFEFITAIMASCRLYTVLKRLAHSLIY